MSHETQWVHLEFESVLRETDKAILVRLEGGEEVWLPLSQVADSEDYREGDGPGTISITEWLAKQKNL